LHYTDPHTPFSHLLPPPTRTDPLRQDLFWPPVLHFCKRKKWHFCLGKLHREFPCNISMYICIIIQIGLSSQFLFFLL
jgi:hypothetical protein